MNRALYASASGMAAEQQRLDVVADNLANADVPGFKAATATFASLGGDAPLGTVSTGSHRLFGQGKLMKTGGPFDVALDGPGFFVVDRDGQRAYTRAGSFARSADGRLRNADGWALAGVRIPSKALDVTVAADGRVTVTLAGGAHASAGRIRPALFDAPERLRTAGSAVFAATQESGPAHVVDAGGERRPKVAFGMLERANVSIVEAMMEILAAQRAFEANAKTVTTFDTVTQETINMIR